LGDLVGRKTTGNLLKYNPIIGGEVQNQVAFKSDHWLAADIAHFSDIRYSNKLT
jgi:hypothetical protein